jgi:tyrosyl-tRNA synthetase
LVIRYHTTMETINLEFVFVEESANTLAMGVDLADTIVKSGLAGTKSEARRHIKSGAIRLNDKQIFDPFARLMLADDRFIIVQRHIKP